MDRILYFLVWIFMNCAILSNGFLLKSLRTLQQNRDTSDVTMQDIASYQNFKNEPTQPEVDLVPGFHPWGGKRSGGSAYNALKWRILIALKVKSGNKIKDNGMELSYLNDKPSFILSQRKHNPFLYGITSRGNFRRKLPMS